MTTSGEMLLLGSFPLFLTLTTVGFGQAPIPRNDRLVPADVAPGDSVGYYLSLAPNGKRALVSARFSETSNGDAGAVHLWQSSPRGWRLAARLAASDPNPRDLFGRSLDLDEHRLVVGAMWTDPNGGNSGAAYVFDELDSGWVETAKLVPKDGRSGDWFGTSCSIEGDRIAIGAREASAPGAVDAGAVYLYGRDANGVWVEATKLVPDIVQPDESFGHVVELEGDRLIVGAFNRTFGGGNLNHGAVYEYLCIGGAWVRQPLILPDVLQRDRMFGVDLDLDGDQLIVGGRLDDERAPQAGAAFIFKRIEGAWQQTAKLFHPDPQANDELGNKVAIDGDFAIVGAWNDEVDGIRSGSVHVFNHVDGEWIHVDQLLPQVRRGHLDSFGHDVALRRGVAVVGAFGSSSYGVGSGYAQSYFLRTLPPSLAWPWRWSLSGLREVFGLR